MCSCTCTHTHISLSTPIKNHLLRPVVLHQGDFVPNRHLVMSTDILKSKDVTLSTKVHLVKAMVFPVVMYGCERWIIKKAECRRIDAFELWC